MKIVSLTIIATLLTLTLICCKKGDTGPAGPEGPQGPQGSEGPQGPIGMAGNANVTQYTFAGHDFASDLSTTLQITTTADTMNRCAWFVYLVRNSGNVYPIPGFGVNGTSDYRLYWYHSSGKANFVITKVAGAGDAYSSIRIIRVYANTDIQGGRLANQPPGPDFSDYYEVCDYYSLPY